MSKRAAALTWADRFPVPPLLTTLPLQEARSNLRGAHILRDVIRRTMCSPTPAQCGSELLPTTQLS